MASHFTLYELHQYIRRVFYLNFEDKIWIEAEIAESRFHSGHYYFTIVEKNEQGGLTAKASASLWRSRATQLHYKFGDRFRTLIKSGYKVRILCQVEFHPRYGYSLIIHDFDPEYTEGFLYRERMKTIARLEKEDLINLNRKNPLPLVIKKIAVISSATAAGYQDFMHQLENNSYQYKFHSTLFPVPMQGDLVKKDFPAVLESIGRQKDDFDIIIVVRGGGATIDLSDFDHYEVAAAIARVPLPVISGIGHERDISVADMVAAYRVKTPTAAAEFVIQNNLEYEISIQELFQKIINSAREVLHTALQDITTAEFHLGRTIHLHLKEESISLDRQLFSINESVRRRLHHEQIQVREYASSIIIHNPFEVMKRGYSMIFQHGKRIEALEDLHIKEPLTLVMNEQKITINE